MWRRNRGLYSQEPWGFVVWIHKMQEKKNDLVTAKLLIVITKLLSCSVSS